MGCLTRQPGSNEPSQVSLNKWGPSDETGALLMGLARRCAGCRRVILESFLTEEFLCPDCHKNEYGTEAQLIPERVPDYLIGGASGQDGEAD